jgi:hypothetical protein
VQYDDEEGEEDGEEYDEEGIEVLAVSGQVAHSALQPTLSSCDQHTCSRH